MRVRFDLPLHLVSMKNSRQPSSNGVGRCSEDAEKFKDDAVLLLKSQNKRGFPADAKLTLRVLVRYPHYLQDLDCEIIPDCLQLAGIVKNDRQIREKHYYADDVAAEPFVVIELEQEGTVPWKSRTKR